MAGSSSSLSPVWGIAIFAARESAATVQASIAAAEAAALPGARIDVLVNGNRALLEQVVADCRQRDRDTRNVRIQIWFIPLGDKANAWNQYFHHIWSGEALAFFIDGYVQVHADALALLGHAVMAQDSVLGGTGVPTVGRSAAQLRHNLLKNGGIHGNLCCVKGSVIERMRARDIRLPVGLYRTDSLVETFLVYDLDPVSHAWDDGRVLVHPHASWAISVAKPWSLANLRARLSRAVRQASGELEKSAFKTLFADTLTTLPMAALTARELVQTWLQRHPADARKLFLSHPLRLVAWWKLRRCQTPLPSDLKPVLVWSAEVPVPADR